MDFKNKPKRGKLSKIEDGKRQNAGKSGGKIDWLQVLDNKTVYFQDEEKQLYFKKFGEEKAKICGRLDRPFRFAVRSVLRWMTWLPRSSRKMSRQRCIKGFFLEFGVI
jgi:hypothetical protein